jgi:glycogen debranching enzyme
MEVVFGPQVCGTLAEAAHLHEWGLRSVSETADGDAPHLATGCPFQAWSVAELLRSLRLVREGLLDGT